LLFRWSIHDPIYDPTMSENRALVVADAEGIIRMWSRGAEVLFGYPAAYALGRSLELLIPERFRERHWRAFHAAMATGVSEMDEVITPTVHADGTEVDHAGRLGLLKDREGATIGAVATWHTR
jgi:PAS domain S-box-containing protein